MFAAPKAFAAPTAMRPIGPQPITATFFPEDCTSTFALTAVPRGSNTAPTFGLMDSGILTAHIAGIFAYSA